LRCVSIQEPASQIRNIFKRQNVFILPNTNFWVFSLLVGLNAGKQMEWNEHRTTPLRGKKLLPNTPQVNAYFWWVKHFSNLFDGLEGANTKIPFRVETPAYRISQLTGYQIIGLS